MHQWEHPSPVGKFASLSRREGARRLRSGRNIPGRRRAHLVSKKEGPGNRLTADGGPYKNWDKEFKSKSTREEARVVGRTVTYISQEINDFYRLIERTPTKARVTYYFDESGKIAGMLYAGLSPRSQRPPDRFEEFKTWAEGRYPGVLDSEEMEIPNQPERWRLLLTQWRAETGLPSIDSSDRAP